MAKRGRKPGSKSKSASNNNRKYSSEFLTKVQDTIRVVEVLEKHGMQLNSLEHAQAVASDIISAVANRPTSSGNGAKRGRKPGSKNKAHASVTDVSENTPKKRGRKPGSKNRRGKKRGRKPGVIAKKAATAEANTVTKATKRGRKASAVKKYAGAKRGRKPATKTSESPVKRGRRPKVTAEKTNGNGHSNGHGSKVASETATKEAA